MLISFGPLADGVFFVIFSRIYVMLLGFLEPIPGLSICFLVLFLFSRRSKGTKNDISGTGSLLYEHNAMILSGVISDLVEPWTIHESKFIQRNKLNPTFNPTLELHVN